MQDETLLRIALVCSVLGLVVLYAWQSKIEIPEAKAASLGDYVGRDVKLAGSVVSVKNYDKVAYLKVMQPSAVSVVLFRDSNFSIPNGTQVEITGEVTEYQGKLQLVASKIKIG
jgi:DNA/RNA endonuclease YhcR with UshA esterase domain